MSGTKFNLLSAPSQTYHALEFETPSGGVEAGDLIIYNDLVGVVPETKAAGENAVLIYKANKVLVPCAAVSTGGFQAGSKVYFDPATAKVTETPNSGTALCGTVFRTPELGDETVIIDLDGTLGIVS